MEHHIQELFVMESFMARECLFGLMVRNTQEGMRTVAEREKDNTLTQQIAATLRVAGATAF